MNLKNKKKLAARVLNVGKGRVIIVSPEEVKEALTRQDILDLKKSGLIKIKEKTGRRSREKRKTRRKMGSIKKKIKTKKQGYVKLTRKLRGYVKSLSKAGKITKEEYYELRKKMKTRAFRSFSNLIETLREEK